MCEEHLCSPLASRRWRHLPDEGEQGWESIYATETSKKRRRWSCCRESAPAGAPGIESSLETHTHTHLSALRSVKETSVLPLLQVKLTVEVAAQQLQSECRPLLVVHWMNPDVTSHKRGNKLIVFYPGVVQITVEYLEKKSKSGFAKSHWPASL